jgi:hypothetical protein
LANLIRILPLATMNSYPPAMFHQEENDPILHLMGEASIYRKNVFQFAWNQFCEGNISKQLGLTRNTLQELAR